ncbi:MAG TPA: hypothetical protein VMT76_00715 [Puia sp.]|nr:hypothetical protein [Puia sp.]
MVPIKDWNANSRDVGMTNEELNTRGMMSTLKQTENNGEKAPPYNAWNGFKHGKPQKFTVKDYSKDKKAPRQQIIFNFSSFFSGQSTTHSSKIFGQLGKKVIFCS